MCHHSSWFVYSHPVTLVVSLTSLCIYTPVCPLAIHQNVDLYSVLILCKPVYCDIVYDTPLKDDWFLPCPCLFLVFMILGFWTPLTILSSVILCLVTLITTVVMCGYLHYCHVPGSFDQSGSSPLTSLIHKAFLPTELLPTECFCVFCTILCKLSRLFCVKIPGDTFLRYSNHPVWHQQ